MRKYLLIYAVAVTVILFWTYRRYAAENHRLEQNQTALMQSVTHYRTKLGQEAASVQVLRLKCGEYEELRADDARKVRALGLKLRRLEAVAKTATQTAIEIKTPIRDTIILCDTIYDTMRMFRWQDAWVKVEGVVAADSVECRVHSVDTLLQIVHRIPRRFLFFRWGTKSLRQEVVSSNPHTRIVYSDYIKIER